MKCKICGFSTINNQVNTRSGESSIIHNCSNCNFMFFDSNPNEALSNDLLDESRLKSAGLEVPSFEKDFSNGIKQSLPLLKKYIDKTDINKNILEIGCSIGYFLSLLKNYGAIPHGLELNETRVEYVNEKLKIDCYSDIEFYLKSKIKFKKIFLFYVIEYIPNIVSYLNSLKSILDDEGEIIITTPNLDDSLRKVWQNEFYESFFFEKLSVNYFTCHSLKNLFEKLDFSSYSINTVQGYSFINHSNWFLNGKPHTSGIVGGDNFNKTLLSTLNKDVDENLQNLKQMISDFDKNYKLFMESLDYGNQIHFILQA